MIAILVALAIVLLASVQTVNAIPQLEYEIDCGQSSDHPFCNGKRGQDGLIFCSLIPEGLVMSCYDDLDFDEEDDPLIDCATDPETKEECELTDSQREAFQDIFRN